MSLLLAMFKYIFGVLSTYFCISVTIYKIGKIFYLHIVSIMGRRNIRFLMFKTLHEERSLSVRRGCWEHDLSSNLVFSEGKRENLLESEFSEYLTGEVTAGMNCHHLRDKSL